MDDKQKDVECPGQGGIVHATCLPESAGEEITPVSTIQYIRYIMYANNSWHVYPQLSVTKYCNILYWVPTSEVEGVLEVN